MTMQVNSSSATDNIYGGCSDKPAADAERQEPVSIFSDKNNNGIVDKKDFDDEATAQLAFEKGLLGRSWDAVKDFIDKLLTTDATENLTKETRHNNRSDEDYTAEFDAKGREIRQIYSDGEVIVLNYDEDTGKVSQRVYVESDQSIKYMTQVTYNEDGTSNEKFYDSNGNFVEKTQYYRGDGSLSAKIEHNTSDGFSTKKYYYDEKSNIKEAVGEKYELTMDGYRVKKITTVKYDDKGNVKDAFTGYDATAGTEYYTATETLPNGKTISHVTEIERDSDGNIISTKKYTK